MASTQRYDLVDVLRGFAIALMFIYHFCFDLDYFKFAEFDFNTHPFWLNFRSLIVSLFLCTVGISLHLATAKGLKPRRFRRRLLLLIVYASAISLVSYLMYKDSMIFFGILHFIAVASVLGLLFVRFYWANLVFGSVIITLGNTFQHGLFDTPTLQWVGLMTHKPLTEDYVPLFPWFGVVLVGLFLGKLIFQHKVKSFSLINNWQGRDPVSQTLAFGGRYALHIYILHQPIFMGILFVVTQLTH